MSDGPIRQHKAMAAGEGLMPDIVMPNQFKQVNGSEIPRGTLLDSQRGATRSGKTDHGDMDGDRD